MISIDIIKDNYSRFSDSEIENVARKESKGLRIEVVAILIDEIRKRKLGEELVVWVNAERNEFNDFERASIIEKFKEIDCPKCGKNKGSLEGYEINKLISYIVWHSDTTLCKILCVDCGRDEKINSMLTTFFVGPWSKKGIVLAPYVFLKDLFNLFYFRKISDRIITNFIESNTGKLRLCGIKNQILIDLIHLHNKDYKYLEEANS